MTEILIEQMVPSQGGIITETKQTSKDVWIHGVFMQAETKNRNGRNYPLNEMINAVKQANMVIDENGGIFGELDHPQTITINMDRISHVITELYMDGNNVIGKARLLDTPMGLIAKELAKSGCRYGVSSRGAGTVNESGHVSGFGLVTVDLVTTPSASGAMPDVIYESIESASNGREILSLAQQVKHDDSAQKYFQKEILKFINEGLFKKIDKT